MKKTNRLKYFIFTLILLLLLVACKDSGVKHINMPTASTTGALYPFGNSLSNIFNREIEDIKINVQASNGGIDNLNLLQSKEADISMAISSNVYQSFNGMDKFEKRENKDIRIITGLYYNPNQIVVSSNSNIDKIEDIKGKKFAPGAPGSTTEIETMIHLETIGLDYPADIDPQYVGFTEAIDLMRNKQVDGAWIMAGAPNSAVSEMLKTTDSKMIEIDKDLVDKLREKYPWYSNYTITKSMYEELDRDINTSAVKMVMFTREDIDEDLIYEITKAFWENIDELKTNHSFLKDLNIEDALKDIADLPLHKGAEKYYREIGILK